MQVIQNTESRQGVRGCGQVVPGRVLIAGDPGRAALLYSHLAVLGFSDIACLLIEPGRQPKIASPPTVLGEDETRTVRTWLPPRYEMPPAVVARQRRGQITSAIADLLGGCDVVVDATIDFSSRYWLNEACVMNGKPLIHGVVSGQEGHVGTFWPPAGPCYRCLFAAPPPEEVVVSSDGAKSTLGGIVAAAQAAEAVKLTRGEVGASLVGGLLVCHLLGGNTESLRVWRLRLRKDPKCVTCAQAQAAARWRAA